MEKIKIFKALENETRFSIFKNVFTDGYACLIDNTKSGTSKFCYNNSQTFNFALPTI